MLTSPYNKLFVLCTFVIERLNLGGSEQLNEFGPYLGIQCRIAVGMRGPDLIIVALLPRRHRYTANVVSEPFLYTLTNE